jgi:hypothetical protein
MHEWTVPFIEEAESRNMKVDCVDGSNVTRGEIASRLVKLKPDFVFLNGHGDRKTFYGHNDEPAIEISDGQLFSEKIVFSRACDCAAELGKEFAETYGCKAFIGYGMPFVNVRQTNIEVKPLQDKMSKPIWEASNAVPHGLVKGLTVSESIEASHRKADKEIERILFSSDVGAIDVLKAIIVNDEGLTHYGDGSAKII